MTGPSSKKKSQSRVHSAEDKMMGRKGGKKIKKHQLGEDLKHILRFIHDHGAVAIAHSSCGVVRLQDD